MTRTLRHTTLSRVSFEPGGVAVDEAPVPTAGPEEVVIAVEFCGLCGSDSHVLHASDGYEWVRPPRVLGHEVVGTVSTVGSAVPAGLEGARVVPIAQTGCGRCPACRDGYANGCETKLTLGLSRDGGAARFVVADHRQLVRVPPDMSALTAVLTEPASIATRAVLRRGDVTARDRVVVTGPGTVGLLCALAARDTGADVIVLGTTRDVETRSELAGKLGLRLMDDLPADHIPSVWIEASGSDRTLPLALAALPPRGRLVLVALYSAPPAVPLNVAVRKEVDIIPSYSSFAPDYEAALLLLSARPDLGALLVEAHPLESGVEALHLVGRSTLPKVALRMGPEA